MARSGLRYDQDHDTIRIMARSEDPGQNPIKSQELSAFVLISSLQSGAPEGATNKLMQDQLHLVISSHIFVNEITQRRLKHHQSIQYHSQLVWKFPNKLMPDQHLKNIILLLLKANNSDSWPINLIISTFLNQDLV